MLHSKVQVCTCISSVVMESCWLSTHILPVEHTGNLITADLSKVLHQTQYMYSFLDDILCMCLYTQIWHRIMFNSL